MGLSQYRPLRLQLEAGGHGIVGIVAALFVGYGADAPGCHETVPVWGCTRTAANGRRHERFRSADVVRLAASCQLNGDDAERRRGSRSLRISSRWKLATKPPRPLTAGPALPLRGCASLPAEGGGVMPRAFATYLVDDPSSLATQDLRPQKFGRLHGQRRRVQRPQMAFEVPQPSSGGSLRLAPCKCRTSSRSHVTDRQRVAPCRLAPARLNQAVCPLLDVGHHIG